MPQKPKNKENFLQQHKPMIMAVIGVFALFTLVYVVQAATTIGTGVSIDSAGSFQFDKNAQAGRVLVSDDASGNASWQNIKLDDLFDVDIDDSGGGPYDGQILYYDSNWKNLPSGNPGQVLTANDTYMPIWDTRVFSAYKTSDETVSDDTLQYDDDFVYQVLAGEKYTITFNLVVNSPADDDIKFALDSSPALSFCVLSGENIAQTIAASNQQTNIDCTDNSNELILTTSGGDDLVKLYISLENDSPDTVDVGLQWAKNTDGAPLSDATTVLSGSAVQAFKVD